MSRYLTTDQLASRLSLSPKTLERWRFEGRGPAFLKFGARVVYDAETVDRWAADQERHITTRRVAASA